MLFEGQKLSGGSAKPTLGSSLFGGQTLNPQLRQQAQYIDANNKISSINATLKNKKSTPQQLYNALNEARKLGAISKEEQIKQIKNIGAGQQAKIQQSFQKSLTPVEKASKFIVEDIVQPTVAQYKDVISAPIKYAKSAESLQLSQAITDNANKAMQKINQDATAGRISWDEAKKRSNEIMKNVNKFSSQASKASRAFQKIDNTKLAANAALTFLDIATLGVGGAALKTGRTVGKVATKEVAKKLAGNVAQGAIYGGVAGGLYPVSQTGANTKLEDALKSAAVGAGIGGAIPLVGAGLGYGAKKISKGVQETVIPKVSKKIAGKEIVEEVAETAAPTIKTTPDIVVQKVNQKTGEKTFYRIPEDKFKSIQKTIDGDGKTGIAGKTIKDENWHITAKTPEDMASKGFKDGGIYTEAVAPIIKRKVPTAPQVGKTDPLEALKAEARKYKSAEEFVKAQGEPVYHGTNAKFKEFKIGQTPASGVESRALFFTKDKSVAKGYGNNTVEAVAKLENPLEIDFDGKSTVFFDGKWRTPSQLGKRIAEINDDIAKRYELPEELLDELDQMGWSPSYADKIDGAILKNIDDPGSGLFSGGKTSQNYLVSDPANVKTKAQLTDLYNQATAPQLSKTEAKVTSGAQKLQEQATKKGVKIEELASYDATSYKANKISADELVAKNKDEAFKIINDPDNYTGAQRQEVYKSLERSVLKGDNVDELQSLARSKPLTERSEAAQTLGQSGYMSDPRDPAKLVSEVRKVKEEVFTKRNKIEVSKKVKSDVSNIRKNIKVPDKYDWDNFIEGLRCK